MAKSGMGMATEFSNWLNSMGVDKKGFIAEMLNDHRTLQQVFTGLCLDWLYALADSPSYDLRNEASIEAAKKVKKALGEGGNYLPFI